jgi:hypothetical protein
MGDDASETSASAVAPAGDAEKAAEEKKAEATPTAESIEKTLNLAGEKLAASPPPAAEKGSKIDADREGVRGDLARGLLWLLTLLIGGLFVFVGIGRVGAEVLTQSVFPSLVTLTGTALGFYFGSQSNKDAGTKP